jgi:hypothetical protein
MRGVVLGLLDAIPELLALRCLTAVASQVGCTQRTTAPLTPLAHFSRSLDLLDVYRVRVNHGFLL